MAELQKLVRKLGDSLRPRMGRVPLAKDQSVTTAPAVPAPRLNKLSHVKRPWGW